MFKIISNEEYKKLKEWDNYEKGYSIVDGKVVKAIYKLSVPFDKGGIFILSSGPFFDTAEGVGDCLIRTRIEEIEKKLFIRDCADAEMTFKEPKSKISKKKKK